MKTIIRSLFIVLTLLTLISSQRLFALPHVIVVTSKIQAAVDAAKPGDTIFVPPGTYHETVRVKTHRLTLVGTHDAIIDATGFADGIHVGADGWITGTGPYPECPPITTKNFTLLGLTIKNAKENGIFLSGVEDYNITRGHYIDNGEYGIFPNCSHNGQIHLNHVSGGKDTCLYVGDDNEATLTGNTASGCTVGVQIVNSLNITVKHNSITNNTAGIFAVVDPLNPIAKTNKINIEKNEVFDNNLQNQATEPELAFLPSGIGIINVGGDELLIRQNTVKGNNNFGIIITSNPFAAQDPRIEPNPDNTQTIKNTLFDNGKHPQVPDGFVPPELVGVDIFGDITYIANGARNCFAKNAFTKSFPENIEALFPCP